MECAVTGRPSDAITARSNIASAARYLIADGVWRFPPDHNNGPLTAGWAPLAGPARSGG